MSLKKYKKRWEVWVSGLGGIITVITLVLDIMDIFDIKDIGITYLVFFILTFVPLLNIFFEQAIELDAYYNARPNVIMRDVYPKLQPIYTKISDRRNLNLTRDSYTSITTSSTVGEFTTIQPPSDSDFVHDGLERQSKWEEIIENRYYFGLIDYINDPAIRNEFSVAKKVISGIKFFDEEGNPLIQGGELIGRWWDEVEKRFLPQSVPAHTLQEIDIEPSGKKVRTLVIAMKKEEENLCFAYNMESTDNTEWRKREFQLGSGKIFACITLAGQNLDNLENWIEISQDNNNKMLIRKCERPTFI